LKGTFVRDFVLPEHWSDELTLGDFRQNRVRIDKKIWTAKNADFSPLQVDFLFQALFTTSFRMTAADSVNRVHNRKIEGLEARCIEFQATVGRSSTPGELCVERDRGALIYWKFGTREIWYSQYMPFAGAVRPMHLAISEQGTPSVEADVSYTEVPELTADGFLPLKNAEITDVCSTSRGLMAKSAPEPMYPPSLSRRQFPGRVTVKLEVDENGHVTKAAVVESVHPMIDSSALEAAKSWVFEPRLCDGKPVSATTKMEVRFR